MRAVLLALCVVLVASAAAAEPPQCRNLDRLVGHYKEMRGRAVALDSELWKDRIDAHLVRLSKQRSRAGCPDRSGAAEAARQLKALLELAAQGALTFFTLGAM